MHVSTAAIWKMKMMNNGETGEVMILSPTPGVNRMLTANKRLRTLSFHAEKSEPNLRLRMGLWARSHHPPQHRL